MGRHRDWRKIAKRERRRRLRKENAKNCECCPPTSVDYKQWISDQDILEKQEMEQIEEINRQENQKWVEAELITIIKLKKLEAGREKHHQKQLSQEAKIKEEWEQEKLQKEFEAERLKKIEKENLLKQEKFVTSLEEFLIGHSSEPPLELLKYHETKPNAVLCPFFVKTSCCRFGDTCSRNHQYPRISKILLATNFYVHFGLENANINEYDTDVMLEYEDSETYRHFKEFFYDVLPEFQKHGQITQFKVCNNYEKHLRGNTYIEYEDIRSAVKAYRALHSRWYGGRQISLQFCQLASWKNAICGQQLRNRCPKGRACNFLHLFINPDNLFKYDNKEIITERRQYTPKDSWRWSESPERIVPKRKRSKSKDTEKERSRHRHKRKHSNRR